MNNITRSRILFMFVLLIIANLVFPQEDIVENVQVEEWIVPIYAVDTKGMSITDLKKTDIELFVNNQQISDFNFFKRKFFSEDGDVSIAAKPGSDVEKIIIFVFDTALSRSTSIMKAKAIAEKLVMNSRPDTRFIIFKIKPFQGLSYVGGPTRDKSRIDLLIQKQVVARDNQRNVSSGVDESEGVKAKYEDDEALFFWDQQRKYLSEKSSHFAYAFESLYYCIANIVGTKFIYLFSEGISGESWGRGDSHDEKMAEFLLRSGAVLFFINPAGGRGSDPESGERFLKVLSTISGGKYLYGNARKINSEIENVHKAYYEITFRSPDDRTGRMLNIEVRAKQMGTHIHTIRNLEKSRSYLGLSELEKNLVALNIVSKNSLFKLPVSVEDVQIAETKVQDSETQYRIALPEHFRNNLVDLFKVHLANDGGKPVIKKSSRRLSGNLLKITMKNIENAQNYFVIVNHGLGTALVKGIVIKKVQITRMVLGKDAVTFGLSDFRKKKIGDKTVGLLKVSIKILDARGMVLKSDEKEITTLKDATVLTVPLRRIQPGKSNLLIVVRDLVSGEEANISRSI